MAGADWTRRVQRLGLMRRAQSLGTLSAVGLATLIQVHAQDARFKSGVDMVPLTVTVTDAAGKYQTGLTQQDFTVLEDGIPQTLSFFASEAVPVDVALVMDTSNS